MGTGDLLALYRYMSVARKACCDGSEATCPIGRVFACLEVSSKITGRKCAMILYLVAVGCMLAQQQPSGHSPQY